MARKTRRKYQRKSKIKSRSKSRSRSYKKPKTKRKYLKKNYSRLGSGSNWELEKALEPTRRLQEQQRQRQIAYLERQIQLAQLQRERERDRQMLLRAQQQRQRATQQIQKWFRQNRRSNLPASHDDPEPLSPMSSPEDDEEEAKWRALATYYNR